MVRTILHVDMDAFFASVEQIDNPTLRGKPVIVGGAKRGVVSTASYEARKFGIKSAMPIFEAKKRCPEGIFLPVRMTRYQEISKRIMDVLSAISPFVEQVSIDEAFVDLTGTERLHGSHIQAALKIKEKIWEDTGLTCSIGIAPNKFLAKIASDFEKPQGLTIIDTGSVEAFLKDLPVSRLPGVGSKSEILLRNLGIKVVSDILRLPPELMQSKFGKHGERLIELARGIDENPVVISSPCKSLGSEDTLSEDTSDVSKLKPILMSQAEIVGSRLRKQGLKGKTVTLKLKHADFRLVTRSRTLNQPTCATKVIFDAVAMLLEKYDLKKPVRLIGIAVSGFEGACQGTLFSDMDRNERLETLDRTLDRIREKLGCNMITRASNLTEK